MTKIRKLWPSKFYDIGPGQGDQMNCKKIAQFFEKYIKQLPNQIISKYKTRFEELI